MMNKLPAHRLHHVHNELAIRLTRRLVSIMNAPHHIVLQLHGQLVSPSPLRPAHPVSSAKVLRLHLRHHGGLGVMAAASISVELA